MKLPHMKYADAIRKSKQVKFGGLNHSVGAGDGELWNMKNLTSDHHPVLATRALRRLYRRIDKPGGLFCWDGLCWVAGTKFYYKGKEKGALAEGKKTFATLGSFIIILPDKCFYNIDTDEFGSLEARWVGASLTFQDGQLYEEKATANTIYAEGVEWGGYFRAGDAVTISGCTTNPSNNKSIIIRAIDGDKLYFYENSFILGKDDTAYTEHGEMEIARTVPDLKYLCENESRLWGCSDTTIYASKLNDIFNWNVYDNLDTDSYAVGTGAAGNFTGCISYRGYPTFFKENHIYKVYGSAPSNFEVMGSTSLGVIEGSAGSLAISGETLFYLGRNGIMAYTGGVPQPVCQPFGTLRFREAAAGSDGLKYYVSMKDTDGLWSLYVYDTQRGIWHREDETEASHFAVWDGNLCFLNEAGEIWIAGEGPGVTEETEPEAALEWWAEFADFTDDDPNKKGVSKVQIRLELENGASVQVWIQFDSDGEWQKVSSALGEGEKRSYYLPIIPRRGDHYRLKLTGTGGCRVHSLVRESYSGSELKSRSGRN